MALMIAAAVEENSGKMENTIVKKIYDFSSQIKFGLFSIFNNISLTEKFKWKVSSSINDFFSKGRLKKEIFSQLKSFPQEKKKILKET